MMQSFCTAANIKGLLQRFDCPPVLRTCAPLLDRFCDNGLHNNLVMGNSQVDSSTLCILRDDIDWKKSKPLDQEICRALNFLDFDLRDLIPGWALPKAVFYHQRCLIHGLHFMTLKTSRRNSLIFYQPFECSKLIPGVIRQIFSVCHVDSKDSHHGNEYFFLVIHRFLPAVGVQDPFQDYPDFGAGLWSTDYSDAPEVVLVGGRLYHAVMKPWCKGINVMKALDRVSTFSIVILPVLNYIFKDF